MAEQEPEKEVINWKNSCQMWIFRRNGLVCIGIEHSKPEALIIIQGLVHILGEPQSWTWEKGDDFMAFVWPDKTAQVHDEITAAWKEAFAPERAERAKAKVKP